MSDDLYDLNVTRGLPAGRPLDEELAAGGAPTGGGPRAWSSPSPARPEHGDVTTNAALVTAKRAGRVPRASWPRRSGARWMAGPGAGVCDRHDGRRARHFSTCS